MNTLTVIGQLIAAAAAVVALFFVGYQIKQARKASDFLTLKAFLKDVEFYERSLLAAESHDEKDTAFIELVNFLEICALALNKKLIPKVSYDLVTQKLCDSLACIQNAPGFHTLLEEAFTTPETCENLDTFVKKHKENIEASFESLIERSDRDPD